MRLRRFNEDKSEVLDLSPERLAEIEKLLSTFNTELKTKIELLDSLLNELENYTQSDQKNGNDQIDDSILNLQLVRKNSEDSLDKIDTVLGQLENYTNDGRHFLYTESLQESDTITIVDFTGGGDGVTALYINGLLYKYGDYYHDKITEFIKGFVAGVKYIHPTITVNKLECLNSDLIQGISENGDIPPTKLADVQDDGCEIRTFSE